MAKKGRNSVPYVPKKGDSNRITIREEDLTKTRIVGIPMVRPCDNRRNRDRELRRGSRRAPKHRGRREW